MHQLEAALAKRDMERGTLPMAQQRDLAVCTWGILDGGVLTGKYSRKGDEPRRLEIDQLDERRQGLVDVLQSVADENGRSPSQVAINWVHQSPYAQIIPIIGARRVEQLADNLACLDWTLSDDQWQRLAAAAHFERGFPEDFIIDARQYLFGSQYDTLDNHHNGPYRTMA